MTYFLLLLLQLPLNIYGQTSDCSYINGQGCYNGICKFCAMCLPRSCILVTLLSTGVNEGSTCTVTNQQNQGYDFYNYCLSSSRDDDGDLCNTSTICYSYRQGNDSFTLHSWDNLTCDSNTCNLINFYGSPPATPIPLNISNSTLNNDTNTTNYHPTVAGNKPTENHNMFDFKTASPASIALIIASIFISIGLLIWLVRSLFYKTKYGSSINTYLCCGFCPCKPKDDTAITETNESTIPNTAPPSFYQSEMRASTGSLPCYFNQEPSPPKYEQAIVTQIRGMRFLDHVTTTSSSSNEQPIWVPVYLSSSPSRNSTTFTTFISPHHHAQDWATQAIRHQPVTSTNGSSEEEDSHHHLS